MVAMIVAMLLSADPLRRISPLLWFSAIMVVVLGGLTIWLHDETFIKMKPTVYYMLRRGHARLRPRDRQAAAASGARAATYPGPRRARLDQADAATGRCSSPAWPVLNEAVWRNSSTEFWIGFKIWGAIPLTFLFAAANMPMLLRHGLDPRGSRAGRAGTPVE